MLIAKLHWDLLETQWSVGSKQPGKKGDSVEIVIPPPTHWRFNERMIHDLDGQIAVQSTLVYVELQRV